jgi:hypothetical protein
MLVVLFLTIVYQCLINNAFAPLFRYLPITLEDEAVERDEAFQKAQQHRPLNSDVDGHSDGGDIEDELEDRERQERHADRDAEAIELEEIKKRKSGGGFRPARVATLAKDVWAKQRSGTGRDRGTSRSKDFGNYPKVRPDPYPQPVPAHDGNADVEAQRRCNIGDAIFTGLNDELEDLTPDQRDILIQQAFQHAALRSKRPVIWIPRDNLGVSDDEVRRTQMFSEHIWISNAYTSLNSKASVNWTRSPPDFSEVELINL